MWTQRFALGALAAVLSAGVANATPNPDVQHLVDHAWTGAQTLVNGCGVDLGRSDVTVRGVIDSDRRLRSLQVIGSTTSRESDRAIERALKTLQLDPVPPLLSGAKLTLVLSASGAAAPRD